MCCYEPHGWLADTRALEAVQMAELRTGFSIWGQCWWPTNRKCPMRLSTNPKPLVPLVLMRLLQLVLVILLITGEAATSLCYVSNLGQIMCLYFYSHGEVSRRMTAVDDC
jgi:hypothetical protein